MPGVDSFDWGEANKPVADLQKIRDQFAAVHEFAASPDGERIAVPVIKEAVEATAEEVGMVYIVGIVRLMVWLMSPLH